MDNKKVIFKNHSNITWNNYNVGGGVFVTIEPKSVFSVGPKAAEVIRKNLCDRKPTEEGEAIVVAWLEEVSEESLTAEEKKSLSKVVEKVDEKEVEKIVAYEAKKAKTKTKK